MSSVFDSHFMAENILSASLSGISLFFIVSDIVLSKSCTFSLKKSLNVSFIRIVNSSPLSFFPIIYFQVSVARSSLSLSFNNFAITDNKIVAVVSLC